MQSSLSRKGPPFGSHALCFAVLIAAGCEASKDGFEPIEVDGSVPARADSGIKPRKDAAAVPPDDEPIGKDAGASQDAAESDADAAPVPAVDGGADVLPIAPPLEGLTPFPGNPYERFPPHLDRELHEPALTVVDLYAMGSSYNVKDQAIKAAYAERALVGTFKRYEVPGAGLSWLWDNLPDRMKIEPELASGVHDVIFMNAQRPWEMTEREGQAAIEHGKVAYAANPNVRLVIQEYWMTERDSVCFDAACDPYDNLEMYRLGALKLAYLASRAIGTRVYVAPVGTAIEEVKRLAASGRLTSVRTRLDLHQPLPDGQHLSKLGETVQAWTVLASGLRMDVRGLSGAIPPPSGSHLNLPPADAAVIQEAVWQAVRGRPFSGFSKAADGDDSLASYLAALEAVFARWEPFDGLALTGNPDAHVSGSFVGTAGRAWQYTGLKLKLRRTFSGLTDQAAELRSGGTLSTRFEAGIGSLAFRARRYGKTAGRIEVRIGSDPVQTFDLLQENVPIGFRVAGAQTAGPVDLTITARDAIIQIDDIRWSERP